MASFIAVFTLSQWSGTKPAVSLRYACASFGCNRCSCLPLLSTLSSSLLFFLLLAHGGPRMKAPLTPGSPAISQDSQTPSFEVTSCSYSLSYGYCCRKGKIKTLDTLERFLDLLGETRAVYRMPNWPLCVLGAGSMTPSLSLSFSRPCSRKLQVSPDFLYVRLPNHQRRPFLRFPAPFGCPGNLAVTLRVLGETRRQELGPSCSCKQKSPWGMAG